MPRDFREKCQKMPTQIEKKYAKICQFFSKNAKILPNIKIQRLYGLLID